MKKLAILTIPAVLAIAGCAGFAEQATRVGVSAEVQGLCAAAAVEEIAGISEDMDFDAVSERLKERGKACLVMAAQDVLTAQIVGAVPAVAGEVVPGDAAAVAAIAE